ncbi:uncharacterized protein BJ212DRAFT_1487052 [Suillus subaureus]|uniref:DUF6532 domain-containing protein n=1 Tax=Suillus subaureus TaxID=48587 RepID=A0A9P7DU67_9AGAM|nr:uncharacterized protein BJ212DRAFT_1487052 [Suillus subaureus]KAG1803341.1 hypothetical protein BJ212DRAFT_1487052 [Suillus subaureus]
MAISKAQDDLCAQMVSTAGRTASGCHHRPTEKETYRILKSQQGDDRQKALQAKAGKRQLKALHTTYRTNPEGFDNKPTELLSNVDRVEDNMFTNRHVPAKPYEPQVLAFSSSKTLAPVLARKTKDSPVMARRTKDSPVLARKMKDSVPVVSADDASSEDSGDEVEDTSQHQLEVSDEDIKPNIKALHGRRQHLKAADFDHITKDVLATTTSIYRCLVVTQAPFPEMLLVETMLAKHAWHEASDITGLTIQLMPSLVKMMTRRTSHASWSMTTIKANHDLAESLKEGISFVFKDWEMKTGIYKMELIQKAINDMWFANRSDEGILYAKYFDPLPLKLMVLVLMVMECCIDEWATGSTLHISTPWSGLSSALLLTNYWRKIHDNLLDMARLHAGGIDLSKTAVSVDTLANDVFNDTIQEYEVEMQVARDGRPQGIEASDA